MEYICNCCGAVIEFDEDEFDLGGSSHPDGEEMLWGHIQMWHEDVYEDVQNLETPAMIEECYSLQE